MKRLLILFLILPCFTKAQWIVQAINTVTGETKYIAMPSGAAGVNSVNGRTGNVTLVKSDVSLSLVDNTPDISKPVSIAMQNALNGKQNTLIAGNNININGNVISSTGGGGGGGGTVLLDSMKWYSTFNTYLTGQTFSNGTTESNMTFMGYKINRGVNFRTPDRPDVVSTLYAYNYAIPNTARKFMNEYALEIGTHEHYFDNPGVGVTDGDAEIHLIRMYTRLGYEIRNISSYINTKTGTGRIDFGTNAITISEPQGNGQIATTAILGAAQLNLTPITGGGAAVNLWNVAQTKKMYLGFTGEVPIFDLPDANFGGSAHFDGYGNSSIKAIHLKLTTATYDNDAQAKANGLVVGDSYWTIIAGRKLLTQVQ